MKLSDIYRTAVNRRQCHPLDALILMEKAFRISREKFWSDGNSIECNEEDIEAFLGYIDRVKKGEPVAYITGKKEFFSESFLVDRNVLVPRPETELLLEKLLEAADSSKKILEIGAGSGILSILAAKISGSRVTAVEIDKKAITTLKKNISAHQMDDLICVIRADLFPLETGTVFDIIVSNPPYLSAEELASADPAVRVHEPMTALLGGPGGHEIIHRIISSARDHLIIPGGIILLEFGLGQKDLIEEDLHYHGFSGIEFFSDLAGIPRVVKALT